GQRAGGSEPLLRQGQRRRLLRDRRCPRGEKEDRRLGPRLSSDGRLDRGRRWPHGRSELEAGGQGVGAQEQVGPVLRILRVTHPRIGTARLALLLAAVATLFGCASTA